MEVYSGEFYTHTHARTQTHTHTHTQKKSCYFFYSLC